jgi:hypothetical protein
MKIFYNLSTSENTGSLCMKQGSSFCINAAEMLLMLIFLVRKLGRVSIVEFDRQIRIKIQKTKGVCRERC